MKKKDILLSILSSILLILSYPNFDLEILAWFSIVPLFLAVSEKGLYHSFKIGFFTGLLFSLGILYWIVIAIHTYGNINLFLSFIILLLLVLYLSFYIALFTFITRFFQLELGIKATLLSPFIWVSLEYLRSFFLSGFPWANLGHSQYLNLPFIQMADITGVYGLSFGIVLANSTLFLATHQKGRRVFPLKEFIFTAIILVCFLIYGYYKIKLLDDYIKKAIPLRIGIVQPNIDQSIKWDESFQKETMEIYEKLSFKLTEDKPYLIIWPETATPFFFQQEKRYQPIVLNIPKKTGAFLLFGTPSYKIEKGKINHYNSAFFISPQGEFLGQYDKIHLVPFGEYVPFGDYIPLGSLGEGIGNFKPGKDIYNFSIPNGKFGVVICFEIIFPDLCRKFVKEDANFLVTITNDAWFGRTSAPYQHFSIAVFRAVENRVFIARAANTGISGFIDPKGKILNKTDIFTKETITGTIGLLREKAFYTKYGDIFVWICCVIFIFILTLLLVRKKISFYNKQ